jgi:hypothetical protein
MSSLGSLSAKYESNSDCAAVSINGCDGGGVSFGIYQFSSVQGVVQDFVQFLKRQQPPLNQYGIQLEEAGDPKNTGFQTKWQTIGSIDPGGFTDLQEAYVRPIYFDAGAQNLLNWYCFDIYEHSAALQAVLWSNCVQHGSYYGAEVFDDAAKCAGQKLVDMIDYDVIYNIYEVKLTDLSWSSGSPEERPGLFVRWKNERLDALDMLNE